MNDEVNVFQQIYKNLTNLNLSYDDAKKLRDQYVADGCIPEHLETCEQSCPKSKSGTCPYFDLGKKLPTL